MRLMMTRLVLLALGAGLFAGSYLAGAVLMAWVMTR